MPTHRFFLEELTEGETEVLLPTQEAQHASRVLRLGVGDSCVLLNGHGLRCQAEISQCQNRDVRCKILSSDKVEMRQPLLHLYIAPPKGKNMDILLKMATELGIGQITPILCRYGVSRPDEAKEGWRETLIAACKQSGNCWLPTLDAPVDFLTQVKKIGEDASVLHVVGAVPGKIWRDFPAQEEWQAKREIALWIGPEGGFSLEEEEELRQAGVVPLTLGSWILRVETAVPALLGAIHLQLSGRR